MKKVLLSLLVMIGLVAAPSCSQQNGNTWDWDQAAPLIENATTLAATLAFAQPALAEHKEVVCTVALKVSEVLESYNDADATFESVRQLALDTVRNLPPEVLSDELKPLVITAVDTVMSGAWLFVRQHYLDMVENNEAQVALTVAKAVARGLTNACGTQTFSEGFDVVILNK